MLRDIASSQAFPNAAHDNLVEIYKMSSRSSRKDQEICTDVLGRCTEFTVLGYILGIRYVGTWKCTYQSKMVLKKTAEVGP
jgi:hypothetical protein